MDENNVKEISLAAADRERMIVRTSAVGIGTNLLLVIFKAIVGFLSNSIAIILDAVNNLSDALSSVITVIGAKLGAKAPDKKHPFGYGRIEYISSMLVSAIVLYAGGTSLVESVKKIISPEKANYAPVTLIIISVAVAVKIALGLYVKKQGKKANSSALTASGSDALFDAVLSFSVLVCAVIFLLFGLSLEAYVGVVISCFIIKAGVEMMLETLNDIIGARGDAHTSGELKRIICENKEVRGAYDVTLFNYGPGRNYGSVHIELPDDMTVEQVDRVSRRIQYDVYSRTGVILTGIGVYSFNTSDEAVSGMREKIGRVVLAHEWAIQMHGFYVDNEKKTIRFDVVVSFDVERKEAIEKITEEVAGMYPGYEVHIIPDFDVSDL